MAHIAVIPTISGALATAGEWAVEPCLEDVLADQMVLAVMAKDAVSIQEIRALLDDIRGQVEARERVQAVRKWEMSSRRRKARPAPEHLACTA